MLKKELRKKILKLRKVKYNSDLNINTLVLIKHLKKIKKKKPIIGGYYPTNFEIDCLNILKTLEGKKFKICLPVIKKKNQMDFYSWSYNKSLKINKYGIPEPSLQKKMEPDVIIVPIVAFDKLKFRIGYGGGYYDRYLEKMSKKKKFMTIGIAFSFQKINKVPINRYDRKLDLILTEKSYIK